MGNGVMWAAQNIVIAGFLALLVQIACRVGRVGPVWRHALWLIVLLKIVTPPVVVLHSPWTMTIPIVSALVPRHELPLKVGGREMNDGAGGLGSMSRPPLRAAAAQSTAFTSSPVDVQTPDSIGGASHSSMMSVAAVRVSLIAVLRRLLSYSMAIWIAGGFVVALVQGVRIRRVVRSLRGASPPSPALAADVESLARRLHMRSIHISVVPDLVSPVIWSANPFRPELLWPRDLPPGTSTDCQRALIVHELAHVKRRDHWVGWLELSAGCAQWWNPLFWYVRARLRENAELACDGWVVNELPHGRRAYADTVLSMCARIASGRAPATVVGVSTGGRRLLERRLAMIMQDRIPLRLSRAAVLSVVAFTLVALPAWAQRVQGDPVGVISPVAPVEPVATVATVVPGAQVERSLPASERLSLAQPPIERAAKRMAPVALELAEAPPQQAGTEQTLPPVAMGISASAVRLIAEALRAVSEAPQAPTLSTQATTGNGASAIWSLSLDEALKLDAALVAPAPRNAQPAAVRRAYWDLVYATDAAEAAQQSLARAAKLVDDNTIKVEVGTLAPMDIVQAKASQAQSQQQLRNAEGMRRTAELSLKRYLVSGTDDPNWLARIDPTDRAFNPARVDVPAAIRRALGPDAPADPREAQALAARRSAELRVAQDVTQASISLLNSADAVRAALLTRLAAEMNLAGEQRKFEGGTSTNYAVVQVMQDLANARDQELRAMLNYRKAEVAFQQLQESGPSTAPAR